MLNYFFDFLEPTGIDMDGGASPRFTSPSSYWGAGPISSTSEPPSTSSLE